MASAIEVAGAQPLLYKHERSLFAIALVLSLVAWIAIIAGTFGIALIYLLLGFVAYLFIHSAFISYLRGTATHVTSDQFPDLNNRVAQCCEKLGMKTVPDAYLLHANGVFNALATRFLGRNFIVLYADVVDALESEPDALNFYIGHELGHIRRNHLKWGWVLFPASILPLVGAAYSRSCEYTCDLHGLACCSSPEIAARGLGALAAGGRRWRGLDLGKYAGQAAATSGFWMSFHELLASYPWLVKRMARILPPTQAPKVPSRNAFAWLLAIFIPRLGFAGSQSFVIAIAVIGILAAVALPAYQDYVVRAKVVTALQVGNQAAAHVAEFYYRTGMVPNDLAEAGVTQPSPGGLVSAMSLDQKGVVHVEMNFSPLKGKTLLLVPSLNAQKQIVWKCASDDIRPGFLPAPCKR